MNKTSTPFKAAAAGGLLLAGLGAGVVLGVNGSASADSTSTPSASTDAQPGQSSDPSKSMRSDEKLLTGDTASKVRAAALAKYPGATIQRVETDSDGVYEAHVVTKAGDEVIVQVGKDFAVTGTQTGGGHGHHGDHDGDGPDDDDDDAPSA